MVNKYNLATPDIIWQMIGTELYKIYLEQVSRGIEDSKLWDRIVIYKGPGIEKPRLPLKYRIRKLFSR